MIVEVVRHQDEGSDMISYVLLKEDNTHVTDEELSWPQPLGCTASFIGPGARENAEQAAENFGCSHCGDDHGTYRRDHERVLCDPCYDQACFESDMDRSEHAQREA